MAFFNAWISINIEKNTVLWYNITQYGGRVMTNLINSLKSAVLKPKEQFNL